MLQKSWQKKYCQLFRSSKHGVDRLEVFDSEEEVGKISSNVIITLENCIKITQDAQKHQANVFAVSFSFRKSSFSRYFFNSPHAKFPFLFKVITKSNINYFSANTENEMHEWISAFQAVAFKDNISRQTIEEDNDLYCSSGDGKLFI